MRKTFKRKRIVRRRTRRIRRKSSKGLKRTIRKVVRSQLETKYATLDYALAAFNGTINEVGDIINPLPQIDKGTGNNQRVGNVIHPSKLVIRGYVTYYTADLGSTSVNVDAAMIGCRLFAYRDRTVSSMANSSIVNYNLLDKGGNSKSYEGYALDYICPHNTKQFRFYADKRFKMLKPYGAVGDGDPAYNSVHGSLFRPFTIVIKPPKKLLYDNVDSAVYPTNFKPNVSLAYSDLMNTAPDTATTKIAMTFSSTLYYKDG